jgi:UDP-glucose 4-epimerase
MKILIIGSEGFIGKTAVCYFKAKGDEVFSVDVIDNADDRYYRISPDSHDFSGIFLHFKELDVCLNASGAANVQQSFQRTLEDFRMNTHNVLLIAEGIRKHQAGCKLINLSSAAVYGNPQHLPITEEAIPAPQSPYGWHKLISEQICREYAEQFGIQTLSLRLFSAYGEGQKKLLFWDIFQKTSQATGNTIEMFGTGKETRDFIYIGEVLKAIDCVIKDGLYKGEVINIASGIATTIAEAVNTFLSFAAPHITARFLGNNKQGDPLYWQADIQKLQGLGFVPQVSLADGLKTTWTWMQGQR